MNDFSSKSINANLTHLRVQPMMSAYGYVAKDWKEKNQIINYSKLYYIEDGEGVVYMNGKAYYPKPGDLVYIPAGTHHGFSNISNHLYLKYWCHFTAYIGNDTLGDYFDCPYVMPAVDHKKTKDLFSRFVTYERSSEAFAPMMAQSLLIQLLHLYFVDVCGASITLKKDVANSKLYKLQTYINQHLSHKISVDQLASYMGLNPSYLIRLFKSHFGTTPIEYINQQRIEKAKEMLTLNTDTIKSIALELGFSTPYYFSTVFKKQTGVSPGQYRHSQVND